MSEVHFWSMVDEIEALRQRAEKLEAVLTMLWRPHSVECPAPQHRRYPCTCGAKAQNARIDAALCESRNYDAAHYAPAREL